jgi:hypothetical protein
VQYKKAIYVAIVGFILGIAFAGSKGDWETVMIALPGLVIAALLLSIGKKTNE